MKSLALVLLVSCVEATEPGPGSGPDPVPAPELELERDVKPLGWIAKPPGENDQGRYLNGEISDPLAPTGSTTNYHLHTPRTPSFVPTTSGSVTRLEAQSGYLTAFNGATLRFSNLDTRFEGIELPLVGLTGTVLRITHVDNTTPNAPYVLDMVTNGVATPYCKDHGPAFASRGRWTTTGVHDDSNTLNFTCFDGVIWKCFTWGYDPGVAPNGAVDPRNDPWLVHQACTRMARADRCGDGTANTYEETSIVIRDRVTDGQPNIDDPTVPPLRIPTMDPPSPNVYWFEAAWTADGAICLSRERWNSMPLDEDSCLPDPRKVAGVQTCDQIGIDSLSTTATFFNSSKVGQLYLNRWHKGTEQLVTVRGMAGVGAQAQPPFAGYVFDEQIGLLMRNPPGSLVLPNDPNHPGEPADLEAVALYRAGADRVLSTSAPTTLPVYTLVGNEGYVYTVDYVNPLGTPLLELHLYKSGTDYVSSVKAPAAGWSDQGFIGFIDPP